MMLVFLSNSKYFLNIQYVQSPSVNNVNCLLTVYDSEDSLNLLHITS